MNRFTSRTFLPLALALSACGPNGTGPLEPGTPAALTETIDPYTLPGKADVTPRFGMATAVENTATNTVTFGVTNTGYGTGSYTLSCLPGALVTSCAVATTTVTVAGGATAPVEVTYSTGAAGNGTVSLLATSSLGTDMGYYYVTIQAGTPTPPPPSANATRVGALSLQLTLKKKSTGVYDLSGTATAKIVDANGTVVGSATVMGDFSRNASIYQSRASAKTSTSGVAVIRSNTIRAYSRDVIKFCVTGVTHASLSYDAAASTVTCAESIVP